MLLFYTKNKSSPDVMSGLAEAGCLETGQKTTAKFLDDISERRFGEI